MECCGPEGKGSTAHGPAAHVCKRLRENQSGKHYNPSMRYWALFAALTVAAWAADADRDFNGRWVLDEAASGARAANPTAWPLLAISHQGAKVECAGEQPGKPAERWAFTTNREDSNFSLGPERWSVAAKWEGAALLISANVSGAQPYTVSDRWKLSPDRATLTIERHLVRRNAAESESVLVYRREGYAKAAPVAPPAAVATAAAQPAPEREQGWRRAGSPAPLPPPPAAAADARLPAGYVLSVRLLSSLSSRNSRGEEIHMETTRSAFAGGRLVVPAGSDVLARVLEVKRAASGRTNGSVTLEFLQVTWPDGTNLPIRAHIRQEGYRSNGETRRQAPRSGAGEAARRASIGASLGGLAGVITGAGGLAGQAAGAAAGAGSVAAERGAELDLPRGATLEIALDEPLVPPPAK